MARSRAADPTDDSPRVERGVARGHVVAAVGLLRAHLAEPWTLEVVAEELHFSRSQLERALDAVVGISPMAYLRQMRSRQMAQLPIFTTDLTIAARSVG